MVSQCVREELSFFQAADNVFGGFSCNHCFFFRSTRHGKEMVSKIYGCCCICVSCAITCVCLSKKDVALTQRLTDLERRQMHASKP